MCSTSGLARESFTQEAFKWVDEKGHVHYADKPAEQAQAVAPVEINPPPSEAQKQAAEAIKQQRIKNAEASQAAREARETARAEKQAAQRKAQKKAAEKSSKENASGDDNNSEPTYIPPCSHLLHSREPCILGIPASKPRPDLPIAKPVQPSGLPGRQ